MFGTYYCDDCDRTWMSGNSWKGVGQQCRECEIMYLPHKLDPLQPPVSFGIVKPPHQQHLCGKCKELGYDCKTHVPPDTEVATKDEIPSDDEDNTSILSTNSSVADNNDDTPVNSDSEADLDEELKRLGLDN